MRRKPRTFAISASVLVIASVACFMLMDNGAFSVPVWKRENPLAHPIAVLSVRDGVLTLADGRAFRPAGVGRRSTVSAKEFDEALRVMAAQGVEVIRDRGDGTAFLLGEPKFDNWCGNSQARWAGTFYQAPLSELLVYAEYAYQDIRQPNLTPRERWRLEGVRRVVGMADQPAYIWLDQQALRYDGMATYFETYDETLELVWKPAPPP